MKVCLRILYVGRNDQPSLHVSGRLEPAGSSGRPGRLSRRRKNRPVLGRPRPRQSIPSTSPALAQQRLLGNPDLASFLLRVCLCGRPWVCAGRLAKFTWLLLPCIPPSHPSLSPNNYLPPVHRGLRQVKELHEPLGWVRVPLFAPGAGGPAAIAADDAGRSEGPVLRAHFLQICVVAMHQNGRDTHIRQVGLLAAFAPPLSRAVEYVDATRLRDAATLSIVPRVRYRGAALTALSVFKPLHLLRR